MTSTVQGADPSTREDWSCDLGLSARVQRSANQPISFLMQKALAHPELISLAAGFVDQQSLPVEATRTALDKMLSDPVHARAALQYGTTKGYLPLRQMILDRLLTADGCEQESNLSVDQVVLTAGSNQMLNLVSECLFEPGDIVLCTAPTYFVYMGVVTAMGVRPVGVAMDDEGMIPAALDEQLRRLDTAGELAKVKAIYLVDYFDNPSGVTLSLARRPQIVEIAKRWSTEHRIHVIEDAAYRELRYEGEDVASLRAFDPAGDTVIVTQTFSKTYSPGIRVGWGILPPDLVEPVCDLKGVIDFGSPNFAQHMLSVVLEEGLYEPHVELLRNTYREKLSAMLAAAEEHLGPIPGTHWITPQGGLYVWATFPETVDTRLGSRLFDLAVEEGILYVPGEYGYPGECGPVPHNTMRLSFGVQSPERIREGMAALGRAVRRVLAE